MLGAVWEQHTTLNYILCVQEAVLITAYVASLERFQNDVFLITLTSCSVL